MSDRVEKAYEGFIRALRDHLDAAKKADRPEGDQALDDAYEQDRKSVV